MKLKMKHIREEMFRVKIQSVAVAVAVAVILLMFIPSSIKAETIEFPEIDTIVTIEPEYGSYSLTPYSCKIIKVTIESQYINNIKGPGEIAISFPKDSGISIINNELDIDVHKLLPSGSYDVRGYDEVRELLLLLNLIVKKQPWTTVGSMLPWGGDLLAGILIYLENNSISLTKGFSFVVNDIIGAWQTRNLSYGNTPTGDAWNDINNYKMESFGFDLGPMAGGWSAKKIETYLLIDIDNPKAYIPISIYGNFTWWDGFYTLKKCGFQSDFVFSNNIDIALIIDSSGSMAWNDPKNLRKEAARIFIDTAQNDDQIAIVDFDHSSQIHWSLQPLTENRDCIDCIKSKLDLIDSSGGTSLSAGLLEGYNQLDSSTQPYKKAAVFLTDGMGSYNNEAELYKNDDEGNDNDCWPIYTIGLGYNTDSALLQKIADTTGGEYFALTDPNQLQNVYFEIAAQISGGNVLASESSVMSTGDTFSASVAIPAGQQSATFLTTWPGSDVNTTLTAPNGTEITPATSDSNIYYAKGLTYELYRATNPEAGDWIINLYGADLAPQGETVNISVSSVGPPVPEDTTPPVITISSPIDGKVYFDQMSISFSFAIEDPETAVTSQTALLNGSPINNNDNILLTQLGKNVLTITATNEANLTSELSITFYVNHFSWLPPIKYEKGSSTETLTSVIQANSTLPLKFAIFDADSSFVEDPTVKVVVEGTTAQFTHGEGDTNIRINQEEGEEPLYIVNIHTNFNKCDYGLEAGNEYNLTIYFNNVLAASTKLRIE